MKLEFKTTTRFNPEGLGKTHRKVWLSACGRYRIVWRNQFMGVDMLPRYFANRLSKRDCDDEVWWDFALDSERRPYKTYKKAVTACCKAAGISLAEEKNPQRRRRLSRGREIWENTPTSLITKVVDLIPVKTQKRLKSKKLAQNLHLEPLPDTTAPKRRGRPKGSKNKCKSGKTT
jgi:hypothetical protein